MYLFVPVQLYPLEPAYFLHATDITIHKHRKRKQKPYGRNDDHDKGDHHRPEKILSCLFDGDVDCVDLHIKRIDLSVDFIFHIFI